MCIEFLTDGRHHTRGLSDNENKIQILLSRTIQCREEESLEKENANQGLLLLLSHFSRVRPCVTPEMAAHQALPSLGFYRQEHWSG